MRITVAFTGASGIIYGKRLVEFLLENNIDVDLVMSSASGIISKYELGLNQEELKKSFSDKGLVFHNEMDLEASISSGTYKSTGMVICPCSMATIGQIASGLSNNLIGRAADVTLKEKRPLILVPRETPLNLIHLRNLVELAESGAVVLPAMPGFYHNPKSLDELVNFIVGKILDMLDIKHSFYKPWPS